MANQAPEVGERRPFRLALVAPFAPASTTATTHDVAPISVTKDTFVSKLAMLATPFSVKVDDPLSAEAEPVVVDLFPRDLKGLRPDAIVNEQPIFRALLASHRLLKMLADGKASEETAVDQLTRILPRRPWSEAIVGALRSEPAKPIAAPVVTAAAAEPSTGLSSLLDKVDIGAPVEKAIPRGGLSSLVNSVAKGASGAPAATARRDVGRAQKVVEQMMVTLLGRVLQHPEVRRLEALWSGAKFLVDHLDFRAGIKLDLVQASVNEIEAALLMLEERADRDDDLRVDLVLLAHEVTASDVEIARARSWAERGEAMRAVVVASGHPSLLGLERLDELGAAVKRVEHPEDLVVPAMKALRADDASRWLVLAINGPLARAPWTAASSRIVDVRFDEDANDEKIRLFTSPVFLIGAIAAASHARIGWATEVAGARTSTIADLPLYERSERGEVYALPLEAFVPEALARGLARGGIAVGACTPNRDQAFFFAIPSVHGEPASTSSLGDQIFTARISDIVVALASSIPASTEVVAIEQTASIMFASLFAGAGANTPEFRIGVKDGVLHLSCRPRRFGGVGVERIDLAARLTG